MRGYLRVAALALVVAALTFTVAHEGSAQPAPTAPAGPGPAAQPAAPTPYAPAPPVPPDPWANKFFLPDIGTNREQAVPAVIAHNFGEVPHGTLCAHKFTITNIYDVPMQIVEVKKSCACLDYVPMTRELKANETAEFTVTMNTGEFVGESAQTLYVTFGPKYVSTAVIRVSATSRTDVSPTPGAVAFGTVPQGTRTNLPPQTIPGVAHAQLPDDTAARLDAQQREIDALKAKLSALQPAPVYKARADAPPATGSPTVLQLPTGAPGTATGDAPTAGPISPSVAETGPNNTAPGVPFAIGYNPLKGLTFNTQNADFPKTSDGKFPFELDIRGRIQADYYYYKATDKKNHLTGIDTGSITAPDESLFEVKRMRLIFAGYMYDPNLRYQIQFDGNTRGLATETTRQNAFNNPVGNVNGGSNISNVDGGVRLLEAWIAYDLHGAADANGYRSTYTLIGGKLKPMGSMEEYLGSANAQFVEFSMGSWMYDSDADNYLFGVGGQIHACEDRFFAMALLTNGADNQVPNYNMDNLPGFNVGWWYDFGGTWDEKNGKWKLYGNSISDIDFSEHPVARVGSAANIVPMNRRSLYTSAEMDFFKAVPGAAGGSNVDSVLGGGGLGTGGNFTGVASGNSPFAVDAFDAYTFDFFAAAKYQGFSIYNEWWVRDLDNFRGEKNTVYGGNYPILYTSNTVKNVTGAALFNKNALVDYGTTFQAGYFLVPHELELAFRYSAIGGVSGDINGNGTFTTVSSTSLGIKQSNLVNGAQPTNTVPVGTNIRIVNGAFTRSHVAQEIAVGVNCFFYGERVKWQTDVGLYTGGNPAANGQSPAGYLVGVDGYMVRTQVQFSF